MDHDRKDLHKSLDLALRIGEMLLSSGAGAADVTAAMLSVTHACGLRWVTADVTFTSLALQHQPSVEDPPAIQMRRVTHRETDYDDLTTVDHVVRDLVGGRITRDEARARIAQTVSSGHRRPRWAVTLGWGFMGAGVALLLGGGAVVAAIAFLAAVVIDRVQRWLSVRRIPGFYQQVAGGGIAALIAVGTAASGLAVAPSQVVTAGIIMLLAGIGFL